MPSSPCAEKTLPVNALSKKRSLNAAEVLQEMEQLHASMEEGEQFPGRRELMQRYGASERAVSRALDELARRGKIIKRVGRGGSIVAPNGHSAALSQNGQHAQLNGSSVTPTAESSNTVIAVAEPDGGIFDQALQMLLKQAKASRVAVTCQLMHQDEWDRFHVPPTGQGPRGYILFRRHFTPLAQRLQAAGHRVVSVGTPLADSTIEVPTVFGDQEQGGYLAVKHLLDLGHRRIAFQFMGDYPSLRRWVGCRHALEEARAEGLQVSTEVLQIIEDGEYIGQVADWVKDISALRTYFARPEAPTAIVSWNDDLAVKLLTLLQRGGISVPQDVSLVGYDNLTRSAAVHPSLTTIDGAFDQQIKAALRLLNQVEVPPKNQTIIALPVLIQRESTAAPRAGATTVAPSTL